MYRTIDTQTMKDKIGRGEILLADVRSSEAHRGEHIPGALSVPLEGFPAAPLIQLDRGKIVVVYSASESCELADAAAKNLVTLGYRHVQVYKPGLQGWKTEGHATEILSKVS